MNNMEFNDVTASVVHSKKKNIGIIAGAAAAVLVGGSGAAYAAVPAVHNTVNMSVMNPQKYCESVYSNNFKKMLRESNADYKKISDYSGITAEFTYVPDDSMKNMFSEEIGGKLFDEIRFGIDADYDDEDLSADLYISTDKDQIASANLSYFSDDGKMYFTVPDLSKKSIELDISEALNIADISMQKFSVEKPDADTVNDVLEKYSDKFVEFMAEGDSELDKGETGEAAGVAYKYNLLSTEISGDDFKDFLIDFAEELQDDDDVRDIFSGFIDDDDWDYAFDSFIDDLKDETADEEFLIETLVDAEGTIRGISFYVDDEKLMGFCMAKEGKEYGIEFNIYDLESIVINAEEDHGKYSGSVVFESEYSDDFEIEFDDFEIVDKKFINGVLSFDLDDYYGDLDSLVLEFSSDKDSQLISADIENAGRFSFEYSIKSGRSSGISEPSDVVRAEDIDDYITEEEAERYIEKIVEKLGIDLFVAEDIVEEMIDSALYGSSYDYDDYDFDYDFDDFEDYDFSDFDSFFSDSSQNDSSLSMNRFDDII